MSPEGGSPMGPEQGGWETVAPSPISFEPQGPSPVQLGRSEIQVIVAAFARWCRPSSRIRHSAPGGVQPWCSL
jgi:2,4-dienoyl-CoA reductase-like NADH-dependent reductase (Old Yellow Enzyme family)